MAAAARAAAERHRAALAKAQAAFDGAKKAHAEAKRAIGVKSPGAKERRESDVHSEPPCPACPLELLASWAQLGAVAPSAFAADCLLGNGAAKNAGGCLFGQGIHRIWVGLGETRLAAAPSLEDPERISP